MSMDESIPRGDADTSLIRAILSDGGAAAPVDPQPKRRRPRTDTRLVDPTLAPDLPDLAGPDGFLAGEEDRDRPGPDPAPAEHDPAKVDGPVETDKDAQPEDAAPVSPLVLTQPVAAVDPVPEEDVPATTREDSATDLHPEAAPEQVTPKAPTEEALAQLIAASREDTVDPGPPNLLTLAYAGFASFADRLATLDMRTKELIRHEQKSVSHEARRLHKKLSDFEPSVVMIGQVKAGKTTLVNALIGRPGLLPADVNPWTSVVTSLHLMPEVQPGTERASFRFFDEKAWSNLVNKGGRVGELASRAGANEELERVRNQLAEMRERSRARLGRRFEMLMGQTHDYEEYGEALIERYVCLGDDFWDDSDASRQRGRFADITRSADLWVNRPEVPLGLCIRDTPGVNDTFMIREQITIGAIRGSRLCVVVLSASQALSSVDLALIRLISNLESRDIVIFVNRIDELDNPAKEVRQIHDSIKDTLARHEGPKDVRIVFGSGCWANHALSGDVAGVGEASAAALMDYAQAEPEPENEGAIAKLWRLSGLPELCGVLAEKLAGGAGHAVEKQVSTGLDNIARLLDVPESDADDGRIAPFVPVKPMAEIAEALDRVEQVAMTTLDARFAEIRTGFVDRIERARRAFLGRATAALLDHLDRFGEDVVWSYDPVGLRTLLRSAFKVHQRGVDRVAEEVYAKAARDFSRVLASAQGRSDGEGLVAAPPVPPAPPPLALGQTIALDLRGSWWNRFWRRTRGYSAFSETFANLIHEETTPIIEALQADTAERFEAQVRATLSEFVQSQREVLLGLGTETTARSA